MKQVKGVYSMNKSIKIRDENMKKVVSPLTHNTYFGSIQLELNKSTNEGEIIIGGRVLVSYSNCSSFDELEHLFEQDYEIYNTSPKNTTSEK